MLKPNKFMRSDYPSVAVRDELRQARDLIRLALDRTVCARGYVNRETDILVGDDIALGMNADTAYGEVAELSEWFDRLVERQGE